MGPGAAGPEAPVIVADVEGYDEQQAEDAHGAGDHGGDSHGAERRRRRGRACKGETQAEGAVTAYCHPAGWTETQ